MSTDPHDDDGSDGGRPRPDAWADAARDRADRLHQRTPLPPAPRRAWFRRLPRQLPTKLAAGVVFLVALTTLLGNLLELREKGKGALDVSPAAAPPKADAAQRTAAAAAPPAAPARPTRVRVALDRIAVEDDGSPGTTDWRFTVEADGQPLLAFEQDDLDDTAGRNVAHPPEASASLRLAPGKPARLLVKGWRLSRLRMQGEPDAQGEGLLASGDDDVSVDVTGSEGRGGAFVFYFSADAR